RTKILERDECLLMPMLCKRNAAHKTIRCCQVRAPKDGQV
ncbi:11187_t:CDS:1, partial [Acaulospora morrowiae]